MEVFDIPKYISTDSLDLSRETLRNAQTIIRPDTVTEIEIRLGSLVESNRFVPGVSVQYFNSLVLLLDAFEFNQITEWQEFIDYYYPDIQGRAVRSRVSVNGRSNSTVIDTVHKKILETALFRIQSRAKNVPHSFRLSLAEETVVNPKDIPHKTATSHVRIKHSKVYSHGAFTYHLSRVWSGKNHHEAMSRQSQHPPLLEVEVETICSTYIREHSIEYLALSMLLKVASLCSENCTVVPLLRK